MLSPECLNSLKVSPEPAKDLASVGMSVQKDAVVWGICFDGVPISGLVVEFLKAARSFHADRWRVHLDLGYDINTQKGNFGRAYSDETDALPPWVILDRAQGVTTLDGYGPNLVEELS